MFSVSHFEVAELKGKEDAIEKILVLTQYYMPKL